MRWRDLKKCLESNVKQHPKILKALKKVAPHVPEKLGRRVFIFTPETNTLGSVFKHDDYVLYLRPTLFRSSQREIDFTVAHEFAHLVLGHLRRLPGRQVEKEANALARKWGFEANDWEYY
jgi:Zn-dependent peptidase ImmA (M78 family)